MHTLPLLKSPGRGKAYAAEITARAAREPTRSMIRARLRNHAILTATLVLMGGAVAAKDAGSSAVPVTVAAAEQRDVPNRLSSVGTVQSLHSVVIRPQVSGVLTEVLFKEGQLVERGALLARIDDRTIQATLAQLQAERSSKAAQLRMAELDFTRYRSLIDQNVVSRQTIDKQAALVDELKAGVLASDATIAQQRVQLSFTQIVSPVRGRVGIRRVDPGNVVQAGDVRGLVTVTQTDPISVVFTLPQDLLSSLQDAARNPTASTVTAYDRGDITLGSGQLTAFDNEIDATTGTIRLRAQFDNRDGRLWPGQFVTVRLQTAVARKAIVVPARAIGHGLNGPFVFRIRESQAQVVPVDIAYQDDEIAVVSKGIAAGDTVVVDGQSRLKAGTAVKATWAAASGGADGT
jgi:membrane fusion protein, multidrug efflux system